MIVELGVPSFEFDAFRTYHGGGALTVTASPIQGVRPTTTGQPWAYPLLVVLLATALGVSGAPAPLYGLYAERWGLAPITTTLVFAMYAFGALGAVLLAGQASDRFGRKPLLIGSAVGMLAGLVVFMTATGLPALFVGRFVHGAAVGTAVVVGSAALLDLRPELGARTGRLTGIVFTVGMGTTVLGAALLAQFAPHPFVTPYALVGAVVLALLLGMLAMAEPHVARSAQPFRVARPSVPEHVRSDFRFAVLGVMASWSVLGIYLSLFPSFAGQRTHIHSLVFGGVIVAAMTGAAAVSQWFGGGLPARRAAVVGDLGTAGALLFSVVALDSGHGSLVLAAAVAMGLSFGLAFGGSLRHLGQAVPAAHRGEVMSAFYVLAYGAMAVPTIVAGWAATEWGLAAVFPWFSAATALACLVAGILGLRR
jgi:MFS family permease